MIETLLSPEVIQRLAGSLLHFFWQGALIAMLAAIALRMLARRSAETRYAVSVTALLLMLAAPAVTFLFYTQTGSIALRALQFLNDTAADAGQAAQAADTAVWTRWIVLAWFAGVGANSARLAAGWALSRNLVRSAEASVPPGVEQMFEWIKSHLKFSKPVRLLISNRINTPAVVGWLRPVVLLPVSALTGLDEVQLRAVLAHELAHIRRHDFLVNTLQRCVESVLFYHPAVWWLSARIRTEREHCCDDLAVRLCGDRLSYAQALIELERARAAEPGLAVAATGGVLTQRVRRILGRETANQDWQSAATALVFVVAWMAVGLWQTSALDARAFPPMAIPPAPTALAGLGMGMEAPPILAGPPPLSGALNAIAAIVTAQPVPTAIQASTTPGKGTIQGVVTRAGSSEPLSGVRVSIPNGPFDPVALQTLLAFFAGRGVVLAPPADGQSEDRFYQKLIDEAAARGVSTSNPQVQAALAAFRAANQAKYSAVSDNSGRFTIKDVPPGRYTLQGQREDYFAAAASGAAPAAVATVSAGVPADVTLPMSPGAVVTGRVRTASGLYQANTPVQAILLTYLDGVPMPQTIATDTTDDHGDYRLFWLPPGDYLISATPRTGTQLPASAGPTAAEQPMKTFYPGVLNTWTATPVVVRGSEQMTGVDFGIRNSGTFKVSGEVHSAVPPLSASATTIGGFLGLAVRDMTALDLGATTAGPSVTTIGTFVLDPLDGGFHGKFEVSNIMPGAYGLSAWVREPNPEGGSGYAVNRIPIDIRDQDLTGLSINLFPSVRVTGTVTVDGHAPGDVAARVSLHADGPPARAPIYQGIASRAVVANSQDGAFTIPAVTAARFRIEMGQGLPPDLYIADVRQGGGSVYDSGIDVGAEQPKPLQILLSSGAGTVTGIVQDAAGRPVSDATVVLVPPAARRLNRALYRTGTSDANGRFSIRGAAPGDYKLFAWPNLPIASGAYYNAGFLAKYDERGKPVNVIPSSIVTSEIRVIAADGR